MSFDEDKGRSAAKIFILWLPLAPLQRDSYPRKYGTVSTDEFVSFPSYREAEITWILMMVRDEVLEKVLSCG
ncbi:hypothetical protein [Acinetobacter dispersus]|uniref:hypothetical protein n=1 Tax=Acinetobacter dispersus TaxID=70348 RepID=UPI0021CD36E9|nr:hypothetical protein [Acinetobacter dispersus]MCU4338181.1 hypothetical protein [Acinetobacter dispersus]